jgi:integrase
MEGPTMSDTRKGLKAGHGIRMLHDPKTGRVRFRVQLMVSGVRRSKEVDTQAEAVALRDRVLREGWPAENAPDTDPIDPTSDDAPIHTVRDVMQLHIGDLAGRGCTTVGCIKSLVRVWERDPIAGAPLLRTPVAKLDLGRLREFFDRRATESRTITGGPYKTTSILREYRTLHAALKTFRHDLEWPSLRGKAGWTEGETVPRTPLTESEKKQMLLALAEPYRTIMQLGIWLNPRQASFSRMERAHLHLDVPKPWLHLPTTKTNKERGEIVPLEPPAVKLLRAQLARHPGNRWVFPSPWKKFTTPIKKSKIYTTFKTAARAIGRPELRFHDLRHQFASELLALGYSVPQIAEAGRWKRAVTIYMHQADPVTRSMQILASFMTKLGRVIVILALPSATGARGFAAFIRVGACAPRLGATRYAAPSRSIRPAWYRGPRRLSSPL